MMKIGIQTLANQSFKSRCSYESCCNFYRRLCSPKVMEKEREWADYFNGVDIFWPSRFHFLSSKLFSVLIADYIVTRVYILLAGVGQCQMYRFYCLSWNSYSTINYFHFHDMESFFLDTHNFKKLYSLRFIKYATFVFQHGILCSFVLWVNKERVK